MLEFLHSLFQNDAGQVSDFWLFFGRFHPMVLHFPIGLLVISVSLEFYSSFRKKDYEKAVDITWLWGTISAGVAVVFGFCYH